ncbi:hypothetical protein N1851_018120 [Merluccius polli]|uniref:Uncharacterized protein n=1 Tax=Merluccius polli TaxID=89951 RepID=A0AA47MNK9_MERPO|nr:hypothetical protein N1851_018120 [Merluccius polli]
MAQNFLRLNESKSEVVWFDPPDSIKLVPTSLGNRSTLVKPQVSFFQLHTIAKIKPFLSSKDLDKVLRSFPSSRFDYCNSLYCILGSVSRPRLSRRLQLVQNAVAAARLLTRRVQPVWPPSYIADHLTPYSTSRSLRWTDLGLLDVPPSKLKLRGDCCGP